MKDLERPRLRHLAYLAEVHFPRWGGLAPVLEDLKRNWPGVSPADRTKGNHRVHERGTCFAFFSSSSQLIKLLTCLSGSKLASMLSSLHSRKGWGPYSRCRRPRTAHRNRVRLGANKIIEKRAIETRLHKIQESFCDIQDGNSTSRRIY